MSLRKYLHLLKIIYDTICLQSFVTCPLSVNWVGFVLICFGAVDSVCSFLFGRIVKYTGRIPLFSMAFLVNVAVIIALLVSNLKGH